jgi:hypothetical protein
MVWRLMCPAVLLVALGLVLGNAAPVRAGPTNHVTDGLFGPLEWNDPNDPNVVKVQFAQVGTAGGATLYTEQGTPPQVATAVVALSSPTTLYLGYDIAVNPVGRVAPTANSFFDVFFQVQSEGNDYVARILDNGTVNLFEKPTGTVSNLNPDGSFDLSSAPWTALSPSSSDFLRANPKGAIGFGPSPDQSIPHVFVEFQLDINNTLGGRTGGQNGLYDPRPEFWSGSGKPGGLDPPFTSGIFSLNANGSSSVTPVLTSNGGPAQQPQDAAIPEPSSVLLLGFGFGLLGVVETVRRRRVSR